MVAPQPRGLTLVELLIGLALTSVMLGALTSLTTVALASWRQAIARAEATDDALAALDQITRDIRVAGYDPRQRARAGIVGPGAQRLGLAADLDGDGRVDRRSKELITYRRAGRSGDLLRVVGRQALPLLSGLTADGLQLAYLDDEARPIDPAARDAPADTRMVVVTLTTRSGSAGEPIRVAGGARLLSR